MKAANTHLSEVIALAVIAILVFLALDPRTTAFSASTLSAPVAPVALPAPLPGEPIPLRPITDLTSFNATVRLDVNGRIDGKRAQGQLTGVMLNNQDKNRITVSGGLLRTLAAKLGGPLAGLVTPPKLDIYAVPDGAYIFVDALFTACIKPKVLNASGWLQQVSPQGLLILLTDGDVARGKLVGEVTLNGVRVKHYVIDGDAFLAAARKSQHPKLRTFGEGLRSAEDADVYVDAKSGYPVAFRGKYTGEYAPIGLDGNLGVQIDLTGINTAPAVDLPALCNKPLDRFLSSGVD